MRKLIDEVGFSLVKGICLLVPFDEFVDFVNGKEAGLFLFLEAFDIVGNGGLGLLKRDEMLLLEDDIVSVSMTLAVCVSLSESVVSVVSFEVGHWVGKFVRCLIYFIILACVGLFILRKSDLNK